MATTTKYNLGFVHNDVSHARFESEEHITAHVMAHMVTKQTVPFYPTVWAFMQRPSTRKYSDADSSVSADEPQWWTCRLPHAIYGWETTPNSTATTVHRCTSANPSANSTCVVSDPLTHVLTIEGEIARSCVTRVQSFCSDCGSVDTVTKVDHAATCTTCGRVARVDNVFTGRQYRRFDGEEDRNHCAEHGDDPETAGFDKQRQHIYTVMHSMSNPHGNVFMAHRYIVLAKRMFNAHRYREDRIHYLHVVVSACLVYGYWQQHQSPHLKSVRFHHTDERPKPTPPGPFCVRDVWTDAPVHHPSSDATSRLSCEPALCAACKHIRSSVAHVKPHADDDPPIRASADIRPTRRGPQRRKRGLNTHLPLNHPLWRINEGPHPVKRARSTSLDTAPPTIQLVPQQPVPDVVDQSFDDSRVLVRAIGEKLLGASARRVLTHSQLPSHIPTVCRAHGLLVTDIVDLYQKGFLTLSMGPCRVAVPCTQCAAHTSQTTCHVMRTITDTQVVGVWNRAVQWACATRGSETVLCNPDVQTVNTKVIKHVHARVRDVAGVVRTYMQRLYSFMDNLYHDATRGVECVDPNTHVIRFIGGQTSPFRKLHLRRPWRLFRDPHTHRVAFVNTRSQRATWQPPPSLEWPPIPMGWCMVVRGQRLCFVCIRTGYTSTMFPSTVAHGHVYVSSFPRLPDPCVCVDVPVMVATETTLRDVCSSYPFYEPPAVLDPFERLVRLRAASVVERRTVTPDAVVTIRRHALHRRFWFGDHMLWKHQLHALHTIVNSTICEHNTWVSSGIAIVPCGGGKTLIGVSIMGVVGAMHSMVVCNNGVSCEQWKQAIVAHTTLTDEDVVLLTSSSQYVHPSTRVVVASYSSMLGHAFLHRIDWGVIILDEVHMVGASSLRRFFNSKNTSLCSIVGLTATPLREDNHFKELHHIIGPFLYRAQWSTLVKQGIVATMRCVDVQCRMAFSREYARATSEIERKFYSALNTEKIRLCASLLRHHLGQGHQVLIFFEELFVMRTYAMLLKDADGYPLVKIESKENQSIVSKALEDFRVGRISVLCFSRTGDSSFDIPNASVGIQISSHNGSRRQEVQRMGRISRSTHVGVPPATGQIDSYFYTLTSSDTREVHDRAHRTQYMAEDEFEFEHVTMHEDEVKDGVWGVICKGMRKVDVTLQPINKKRITGMIRDELQIMNTRPRTSSTTADGAYALYDAV